ncbi:MAG: Zn-ribbon domain-containing OB-fold protein [Gulosibacter sp.]|uniref:Zn-ribbon domain-containing OB-fold protein n=1 Tax=Gulosibacter sp. TaxID=2817531 RepID=UPI003F90F86D
MKTPPLPVPTPETREFWDAANRGKLRIQRCNACTEFYFYPRPFCPDPTCASSDVEWRTVSGRATLTSYSINFRPLPQFGPDPQIIAIVTLEEGPRMLTNIVGIDPAPDAIPLGSPLRVDFEQRGDMKLPVFRLATEASA